VSLPNPYKDDIQAVDTESTPQITEPVKYKTIEET
jgi:hypothetical protein